MLVAVAGLAGAAAAAHTLMVALATAPEAGRLRALLAGWSGGEDEGGGEGGGGDGGRRGGGRRRGGMVVVAAVGARGAAETK